MEIIIQYEAQLRDLAGKSEMTVDMPQDATIPDAMKTATAGNEGLCNRILREDGISHTVLVFVNEQPVSRGDIKKHILNDGDTVLLLPPISGG